MGARFTFFCIGDAINSSAQAANMKLALSYGDEIENHSMHHTYFRGPADMVPTELEMAQQLGVVRSLLGNPEYKQYAYRPPGGNGQGNPYLWKAAQDQNLRIVVWNDTSPGWTLGNRTDADAVNTVLKAVYLANGVIILQHTVAADAAAFPSIIAAAKSLGFSFGLIGDLVGWGQATWDVQLSGH